MTIKFQLQTILKVSGFTQEKLAQKLNVSFATINSWINGKSNPRRKAEINIEELYKILTGESTISREALEEKFRILKAKKVGFKNIRKLILDRSDLFQDFMLSLTYNSNKIEGSTLTMDETAGLLFGKQVLIDKSMVEQLEVINHQAALNFVFKNSNLNITEELILKLHAILMNGIREDAGSYRNHGVRIVGSFVPTANYLKIPELMKKLIIRLQKGGKNIIEHCATVHALFEKIHPFADGNGRVGRLIMTAMLLTSGFPPALIHEEKRRLYYNYLRKAQIEGNYSLLEDFLADAVLEGFKFLE